MPNHPNSTELLELRDQPSSSVHPPGSTTALPTNHSLKHARRARGLSQVDLANLLGISQSRISAWENGYDEIPYRQRLKLIDVLTNQKGIIDPLVKRIIKSTPNLIIYTPKIAGSLREMCHLYASPNLVAQFSESLTDFQNAVVSKVRQTNMRELDYINMARNQGRGFTADMISLDVERDLPVLNPTSDRPAVRLYTQQFALQFEDHKQIIVTQHHILGPTKSKIRKLHGQTFLSDYDRI